MAVAVVDEGNLRYDFFLAKNFTKFGKSGRMTLQGCQIFAQLSPRDVIINIQTTHNNCRFFAGKYPQVIIGGVVLRHLSLIYYLSVHWHSIVAKITVRRVPRSFDTFRV